MRKFSVLLLLLMTSFAATAVTLPPIQDPKDDALPIKTGQPTIPCEEIINRLVEYNKLARQHDQSLTSFLGDVSTKVSGWYDVLSPLEGTEQKLAADTFLPLKDGADKISKITDMAYDNSSLLAAELDHIIGSMRTCATMNK